MESLEVDFENESDKFQLIQPMPRKIFREREKSLEECGLFPKALLQIQEI